MTVKAKITKIEFTVTAVITVDVEETESIHDILDVIREVGSAEISNVRLIPEVIKSGIDEGETQ